MKLIPDILFDIVRCYSRCKESESKWIALLFSSIAIARCANHCITLQYHKMHEIDCVKNGWLQCLKFIYLHSLNTKKLESLFNLTARGTTPNHLDILKWIISEKKITKKDIQYAIIESNTYGNSYTQPFLQELYWK